MFDNIGKHNDEEAVRRSFVSVLITSLLVGAGAAFVIGWTTVRVIETILDPLDPGPIAMADPYDPLDHLPQESAPPPPLRGVVETPLQPVAPDELQSEQRPLEPMPLNLPVASEVPAHGVPHGSDLGTPDGQTTGVPHGTGRVPGAGFGGGGGGFRSVHHDEITPKRRVHPIYPRAFQGSGLGDQRCRVRVQIDRKGVPTAVEAHGCPEAFQRAAVTALGKWRWYAPKVNGERTAVQTTIAVVFKE